MTRGSEFQRMRDFLGVRALPGPAELKARGEVCEAAADEFGKLAGAPNAPSEP